MRRHHYQRSLPVIFFVCIVTLLTSILTLLPAPIPTLPTTLVLSIHDQVFSTPSASLVTEKSLQSYSKETSILGVITSFFSPIEKISTSPLEPILVRQWVHDISTTLLTEPVAPTILFATESGKIVVTSGSIGSEVKQEETIATLMKLDITATNSAQILIETTGKTLSEADIIKTKQFAESFIGKNLTLKAPRYSKTLTSGEIITLLDPLLGVSPIAVEKLANEINEAIGTPPVEPVLTIVGTQITQFVAPKDGSQLDKDQFNNDLSQKLDMLSSVRKIDPMSLTLIQTAPKNTLSSLNTLGISERVGIGESEYAHSIPNRIKNVSLTTSKIHAKLIMPGEEFSFNRYLGEVSAATGFLPAYVIKQGQTVLGDGGGVCQVSSTLFRAVLNSGLPITERKGHSYRVSYYEENSKPGFDATVFSPHPDFRFRNDTSTPILINAIADPQTLSMYVELWGKKDGRVATITNYRQWDAQPAPPAVYQDDPTLPHGKIKQIDFAASGIKTSFDYIVTYPDGTIKTKNFATNYVPWRAVYLRGI